MLSFPARNSDMNAGTELQQTQGGRALENLLFCSISFFPFKSVYFSSQNLVCLWLQQVGEKK